LLLRYEEGNIIVHSSEQEAIKKVLFLLDIFWEIPYLRAKELKERLHNNPKRRDNPYGQNKNFREDSHEVTDSFG
jgi:hypothetical protein